MIFRSLITVAVLLLGFEILLRLFPVEWDTSQNDKTENIIEMENFIYNLSRKNIAKDTIIVGSSISKKIVTDSLGKNFVNLGLHNCGAWDGLYLLKKSGAIPSCILVESNILNDIFIKDEVEQILNPISCTIKPLLTASQLEHQPAGLLTGFIRHKMQAKIAALKKSTRDNPAFYNNIINVKKENFRFADADTDYVKRLSSIKELISYFQSQRVTVIFFEVPIDSALINTNKAVAIRKHFQQVFPVSLYNYLPVVANNYLFSDGIHLAPESALEFTKSLSQLLSKHP